MRLYQYRILKTIQNFAPSGADREFRLDSNISAQSRNRGRAAKPGNIPSRKYMPRNRPARPHFSARRAALAVFCVFAMSAAALAQEQPSSFTDPLPSGAAKSQNTRIEIDQDAGAIHFVIDGAEVARLDAAGLHVREGVSYGGMLTDYGQAGFDGHTAEAGEGRDAP
jgi:hypothetical protein